MALQEKKVPVTSGKKKARIRKETNAVSGMKVTIMQQNRHRKPPHLPSRAYSGTLQSFSSPGATWECTKTRSCEHNNWEKPSISGSKKRTRVRHPSWTRCMSRKPTWVITMWLCALFSLRRLNPAAVTPSPTPALLPTLPAFAPQE